MSKKQISILLIDDDEVDQMTVQRAFKKNNLPHPLHIATNGIEALNLLRGIEVPKPDPMPSIILLDINMPKMGGIEFLKELRSDPQLRPIRVFILTTSNEERDKWDAYNLNVAGYIIKPVSFDKFVDAIKTLESYWEICETPPS